MVTKAFPRTVERIRKVVDLLMKNPGLRVKEIDRELGFTIGTTFHLLTRIDESGYLLYEDEDGKLYVAMEANRRK